MISNTHQYQLSVIQHITLYNELQAAIGSRVNLKAAVCRTCTIARVNLQCSAHAMFTWAASLHCVNCNVSWSLCKLCPNHKTRFEKPYMLSRQHKLHHNHLNATQESLDSSAVVGNGVLFTNNIDSSGGLLDSISIAAHTMIYNDTVKNVNEATKSLGVRH
jgi:hypothetical protein